MAVLVIAEVEGVTAEMHAGMLAQLAEPCRQAQGFIVHLGGPHQGAFRVYEIWETKEDATRFFSRFVHPNLPPGVRPQRTFQELSAVLLK